VAARAGVGPEATVLPDALAHGELLEWSRQVLATPGIRQIDEDTLARLTGRPRRSVDPEVALLTRLESFGTLFGILGVALPAEMLAEAEESSLFLEVAGDVAFALHAAGVGEQHRAAEVRLATRTQQLEAVQSVSIEITRELRLPALLDLICRRAAELVNAASGTIRLWDEEARVLVPVAFFGQGEWIRDSRLRLGEGLSGRVAEQGSGLIVNDYRTSVYARPEVLRHTKIVGVVAEPLQYRDRLLGVLTADNTGNRSPFTEEDRQTLGLFATQAAIAIENARLYEASRHELAERRQAEERLTQLNDCLLSFGPDPLGNIDRLVALCGTQLRSNYALYNRLKDGKLCSWGRWNAPPDLPAEDLPEGHICYDVIRENRPEAWVLRDLQRTPFGHPGSGIARHDLGTYVGQVVTIGGNAVGALCLLYQGDRVPTPPSASRSGGTKRSARCGPRPSSSMRSGPSARRSHASWISASFSRSSVSGSASWSGAGAVASVYGARRCRPWSLTPIIVRRIRIPPCGSGLEKGWLAGLPCRVRAWS
jgi:putative methionine-R-sulfoxide reductase with GAF domain